MAASITYQYISLTVFAGFTSLFFGAATILESHANLTDLRAEWLRNHVVQVDGDEQAPRAADVAFVDTDSDGLADDAEAQHKCDPHQADTDHDGLLDGQEIRQFGTDPHSSSPDQDGDGVTDYAEAVFSPVYVPGVFTA